jgi:type IV pilus assembly protein PilZ
VIQTLYHSPQLLRGEIIQNGKGFPMAHDSEKRRTPRAPVSIRIDYSTVDQVLWDFASNINTGGVFVESNNPLEVGTLVHVKFYLPDLDSPIETTGEVVWVGIREAEDEDMEGSPGKPGMGIVFKELDSQSKTAINRLVKELRKK